MSTHDIVVVGGGHNGLIAAAYLAKAGLDVCVIESNSKVGGAAMSEELTLPGFKQDPGALMHMNILANPLIHRDELKLVSKYGLKYVPGDPCLAVVFPDQTAIVIYTDLEKTCKSIAKVSERDAEKYAEFCETSKVINRAGGVVRHSLGPTFGRLMAFMDSSDQGREYMRVILSSTLDIAEEWFESEKMRLVMARFSSEVMIGPREAGTGALMFGVPSFHRWGVSFPRGGSGALTDALEVCLKDLGGTIRLLSPVRTIKVVGGEAKGAVLESGEEIVAKKAIVSAVNVKQLFLDMLKTEDLPEGFQHKVARLKFSSFSGLLQAVALNEAPKYRAGGEVDRAAMVEICPFMEEFTRTFEDFYYGVPATNMPLLGIPTLFDKTRAPEGKHSLYCWQYEPYDLENGGAAKWDERKQEIANGVMETVSQYTTNMHAENILGNAIISPLDLERMNRSLMHGDVMHIGQFLSQFLTNRPVPGWGQNKTPISKLYMCGAGTHPGGSVAGGGRVAAIVVMEDLGIDFKKIMVK